MADLLHSREILLADDDKDDILLFHEAFEQLLVPGKITTVHNGEELMQLIDNEKSFHDILFLDLNMPLKNGLDCLSAIKKLKKLQPVPVVIFSTSYEVAIVNQLYANGAQYYMRKPNDFTALAIVIGQALALTSATMLSQPSRDKFVLSS
ncbi:MAG: response regulator [Chitinophagaceae bacterium]